MVYTANRRGMKLSNAQALAVRQLGQTYPYHFVAKLFGISRSYAGGIVTMKNRARAVALKGDIRAAIREAWARRSHDDGIRLDHLLSLTYTRRGRKPA